MNRRHALQTLASGAVWAATPGRTLGRLAAVTPGVSAGLLGTVPSLASTTAPAAAEGSAATSARGGAFDVLESEWMDAGRKRRVPMRLYLPHRASEAQPAPIVVFSHGIGGSRRGYSYLGTHWASQGWASLHVQHVGSDHELWRGGLWSTVNRLQAAAQDAEAVARAHDLRFALDELFKSEWGLRLDGRRIVAAGHSYGANTALLATGAHVWRDGQLLDLRDDRFRAAILISAPPFYGEGDPGRILAPVQIPTLHITATDDVIRIPGYYSGLEDRLDVFQAIGSAQKWLAVFEGGSHSMFTDRLVTGGAVLNPKVKSATRELALAFLNGIMDGRTDGLERWPQQFAPLLARYSAPG